MAKKKPTRVAVVAQTRRKSLDAATATPHKQETSVGNRHELVVGGDMRNHQRCGSVFLTIGNAGARVSWHALMSTSAIAGRVEAR